MIMAEAHTNPMRFGGYDDEFVDNVEDDLLCPICCLPLKEAIQTRWCGHRFCRACIDSHLARQETDGQQITCPVCRTNLNTKQDIFEDLAADRKIRSYTIKCPRRSRGCQWTDELRAKDDHLASCPHEVVSCTNKNCNVILERKGLEDHVATKCDWRILRCKFCTVSHPALQMEVDDHKENECALVEISCPYSKLGCPEKFQRKEKTNHLHSCSQLHLNLACVKLTDAEEELRTTKEHCMKLEQMDVLRAEQITKLEQRVSSLENRGWPHYNVYTWKIGGFQEILKRAKRGDSDNIDIYSDPFYIGECSYKFRMNFNPNGNGEGKNTHLSLFLANVEGEYDAILRWPILKKVTLTLIDQQENLYDRLSVSRTLMKTRETWRSRPINGEESYWGFDEFVSHDELQKRAYIVEDTIFLQAKFE
ncbi:PREDICTED: TNF receptor-associated factor 4-like isoform X2 [Acropora digitifera]|uniref:TNF receptor-associated factor 4-like isoform X2 n=1 Tax=Acropora digitifera TaxID=70779 RepID=UPI00077AEBEE|nr:PREDICTED: TNF receptor-associated factor 4-like isoform X2 [Acropora digitifera]